MSNNDAAVAAEIATATAPAPAAAASSPAPTAAAASSSDPSSNQAAASTAADATSSQQQSQQSSERAASSPVAVAATAGADATPSTTKAAKAPRTQRGKAKTAPSSSASASPPAAASPDAAVTTVPVAEQASPDVASSPSSSPTSAQPQKAARQPRQGKKAGKQQQQQQQQQGAASSPEAGSAAVAEQAQSATAEQTTVRGRKLNNKQQAQAPAQSPTAPTDASSRPPVVQAPKREGRGKQKQTPAAAVAAAAAGPSQLDVLDQMLASQQEVLRQLTALKLQAQQPAASAAPTAAAAPSPVVATAVAAEAPAAVSSPAAPTRKPMQRHPTGAGGAAASASANTSMRVSTPAARPASAAAPASSPPAANPSRSMPAAAAAAAPSGRNIIVLKVGSASLSTDDCKLLHLSNICNLVETICTLKQNGWQVILVTSGAVAVGCQRLGLTQRPTSLVTKQAVAAIGQSRLMRVYDDLFSAMSQPIAQVLLTRENLSAHHHYVNALNTFRELLRMGIVPVVNENDVVSVSELKVGDNDTLSALVASLVQARWLFLLTDVAGLYDSDPRSNPGAKIVHTVQEIGDLRVSLGSSGSIGTGGMTTKLVAAGIATAAGVHTGIIKSTELGNIERMMRGELVGTHFLPVANPLKSHKKWIAHGLKPEGAIVLDAGASDAIVVRHTSLFSAGVVGVQGKFAAGASVRLLRADGKDAAAAPSTPNKHGGKKNATVATPSSPSPSSAQDASPAPLPPPRGRVYSAAECASLVELGVCVVNFEADEVLRLSGQNSREFARILGYDAPAELASRENLVITFKGAPSASPPAPTSASATPASPLR